MAFKLSQSEISDLHDRIDALKEGRESLDQAYQDWLAAIDEANRELRESIELYNQRVRSVAAFAEDVSQQASNEIDEHDESWITTDEGTRAQDYQQTWEQIHQDIPELFVEFPEVLPELESASHTVQVIDKIKEGPHEA